MYGAQVGNSGDGVLRGLSAGRSISTGRVLDGWKEVREGRKDKLYHEVDVLCFTICANKWLQYVYMSST